MPAGKEYVALMHIHKEIEEKKIRNVLNECIGTISQLPPVRSAVKRQVRQRRVYYIQILAIQNQDVLFRIGCQGGTYIRKFIHDVGQKLKVGAHMAQLVRTKAGPFTDKDYVSLQDLKDAYEFWKQGDETHMRKAILPFERAVDHLKKIWVFDNVVNNICHGSYLGVQGIAKLSAGIKKDETVVVMTLKDECVALAKAVLTSEEMIQKEKECAAKTEKVFMPRNIYTTKK